MEGYSSRQLRYEGGTETNVDEKVLDLIQRMRSMYREIENLKRHASIFDDPYVSHHQEFLEEQFEILRQHLNDTIQRVGAKVLLDAVPATPPLVDITSLTGSKRERGSRDAHGKRARHNRNHNGHLPACLQDLCNPAIGDMYNDIKVGAYMIVNVLVLNIQRLQPRAQMVPLIGHGTVLLLHEAVSMNLSLLSKATSDNGGLATLVCASFWLLAKFGGIRGVTPDASLVSMAAGIKLRDLCVMELEVMEALGWDIIRPLKKHPELDIQSLIM
jgi:hypothetical protein